MFQIEDGFTGVVLSRPGNPRKVSCETLRPLKSSDFNHDALDKTIDYAAENDGVDVRTLGAKDLFRDDLSASVKSTVILDLARRECELVATK